MSGITQTEWIKMYCIQQAQERKIALNPFQATDAVTFPEVWWTATIQRQYGGCGLLAAYRRTRGRLLAVPYSWLEPGELSQWFCYNDSTANTVLRIIITVCVGDGRAGGNVPSRLPKKWEQIFFGQLSCKIRTFFEQISCQIRKFC